MSKTTQLSAPVKGSDIKTVISEVRAKEIQTVLETRSKILGRVRGYEYTGGSATLSTRNSSRFMPPIYDLSEIGKAADIEPYINQSVRKHREQIMKEGYIVSGADETMVAYIKRRLFEIAVVTGITTQQWLREVVSNLVTYHNAFLVFRRDRDRSSGKPIRLYGKELDPIAGIFVGDPTSMEVSVDKWGTPKKWRQRLDASEVGGSLAEKNYNVEDVVHITIDKKTGFTFGTPYILPVLDDIRALRKLEEVAVIVASKEAFPLYHYKVGTETRPAIAYEGGDNEVDQVLNSVAGLPAQGYVVTSERHEIKLISREGSSLDLSPYLDYFESRVIAGLRLSPLDLGRGGTSNRATAGTINKALQESAKDYQMVIADLLTHFVIFPMLLEGGFDVTEENMVMFEFPTIDKEQERADQNHGLQLFMGNVLSRTEFRKKFLNRQPMSDEDDGDTNLRKTTDAQKELVSLQASLKPAAGSDTSVSNTIKNRGQPTNQHGTKPTKTRITANDYESIIKERYSLLKTSILNALQESVDTYSIDELFREFIKNSTEISKEYVLDRIEDGHTKAKKQYDVIAPDNDDEIEEIGQRALDRFFSNFITKSFWKIINPHKDKLFEFLNKDSDDNIDIRKVISCLEALGESINLLTKDQLITSERFGFIKFAKKIGSKTIELVNPDNLESTTLDISDLVYKNFIPTQDNISHFLSLKKK